MKIVLKSPHIEDRKVYKLIQLIETKIREKGSHSPKPCQNAAS
jgi:hypothetical protein